MSQCICNYSVEVILRAEAVETAQAGDKCDFTGTLIVVPDVGSISLPGARAESAARKTAEGPDTEGVRGLKALGVRDLNYRLAFLACSVVQSNPMVNLHSYIRGGRILSLFIRTNYSLAVRIYTRKK